MIANAATIGRNTHGRFGFFVLACIATIMAEIMTRAGANSTGRAIVPTAAPPTLRALRRVDVLEEHPGRALAALALGSFILRFAFALNVRGPVYFRDEYLYSALARAISHGSLLLRGQHVPLGSTTSYLVPLITAPVWRLHDVDTAYRLAQALGSLAFATTGFAAYALARRVGVSKTGGVFVAGMSLLVPVGSRSPATLLTEPYAYPAFVASLLVAVPAIAAPSVRRVLAVFVISVGLCLVAGLQFAFFGPAWLIAFIGCIAFPANGSLAHRARSDSWR